MDEKEKQQIRLKRFGMALITYAVVVLTTNLITRLGLGEMNLRQWLFFTGLGFGGNTVFFILFRSNINLRFTDPSLTRAQIVFSGLWGMVPLYALPAARPIVLMFYLPAFSFGMLRLRTWQYLSAVLAVMSLYAALLSMEYLSGRPGFDIDYELFLFVLFGILLLWTAFFGGFISELRDKTRRQNKKIEIEIEERRKAQSEKDQLILRLKEALSEVKVLSGLLPICSICKKIRDDTGYWNQLEAFIGKHSDAEFSHGICPDCAKLHYPDFDLDDLDSSFNQDEKD
jgi:hypothetical protein